MIGRALGWRLGVGFGTVLTIVGGAPPAHAQAPAEEHAYDLPAQDLGRSLRAVAVASGRNVIAAARLIQGRVAPALHGRFSAEEAVAQLLVGSGLHVRTVGGDIVVEADAASARTSQSDVQTGGIVVTGSRIRGAPVASTVVAIDSDAIRDAGQTDLGEVARSVPQSFGGGQNPGIGFNVPSSIGGNIGGGSSFNLRGLGSDATLTILNGRRLPYDSSRQGIDVSAIPLAAVDRVEIVPDGSSALYGSDAVGGVVNVILKRDFAGLETRARLGASTAGGDVEQQYGAIAGLRWGSGGGFLTYEYDYRTPIRAADRNYAASRPGITLLPGSRHHALLGTVHQQLGDTLSIEADGLFSQRTSATTYPLNFAGDLDVSRTRQSFDAQSHALATSLTWLPGAWRLSLTATHGQSRTRFTGDTYYNDAFASSAGGRYDNRSLSGELAADGPLFSLPRGSAKLALGAGVRSNDFTLFRGTGAIQNIDASQDVLYAYGELSLPLVSPAQDLPLLRRFDLSGALRYERYRGIAAVVTPKIGAIYSPSDSIDLKATWGRSFRAPSFIQQYQVQQVLLYPATTFGGAGYPAGATALLRVGGNAALNPVRARSWSASLAFHPASLPGMDIELGYFSTRYVDRIVNPIPLLAQALSNPLYRDRITFSPTAGQQAAVVAEADQFLNITGTGYDPTKVVALIDGANVNAGRQSIHGLDALVRYQTGLARGSLELSANGSYLKSEQQLSAGQPLQPLAGQLFNPPHWRARGMVTWVRGSLTLASTVSYVGGVVDQRTTPSLRIAGMTTADLTVRYRFADTKGPLTGAALALSVQNLFDDKPSVIATSVFYDTPYDSTNYSPVGRFVAVELSKRW